MIRVQAIDLARGIQRVKHAMAKEPSRPVLQSIHVTAASDSLRLVATDNYRLAEVFIAAEAPRPLEFLLDAAHVPLVLAWLPKRGSVKVTTPAAVVEFTTEDQLGLRLPVKTGEYPKFDHVLADAERDANTEVWLDPRLLAGIAKGALRGMPVRLRMTQPDKPILVEGMGEQRYREVLMPARRVQPR